MYVRPGHSSSLSNRTLCPIHLKFRCLATGAKRTCRTMDLSRANCFLRNPSISDSGPVLPPPRRELPQYLMMRREIERRRKKNAVRRTDEMMMMKNIQQLPSHGRQPEEIPWAPTTKTSSSRRRPKWSLRYRPHFTSVASNVRLIRIRYEKDYDDGAS